MLSMLRLGADLDLIPECDRSILDMLLLEIQPAHLQMRAGRELSPQERDVLRAEITRQRLQTVNGPINVSQLENSNPPDAPQPESNDE